MTEASSDHNGVTFFNMEARSPIHQKANGNVLNIFVLHKGKFVICSDEAFCLILITRLTATNSVILHNGSKKKEKIINTHITFTFHVGYLSTGQIQTVKGVRIIHI